MATEAEARNILAFLGALSELKYTYQTRGNLVCNSHHRII
jgi:hypothetical protein